MRKRRRVPFPLVVGGIILLVILILWRIVPAVFSPSAVQVVEEFYTYEQEGNFGSSWELFHPMMHARFTKNGYVTERSHIYMSHYGVTTFSFEITDHKKIKTWKAENTTFKDVQEVQLKQTFKSKFGVFSVTQNVYAVKEKDEWRLLWEFK